MTWEAVVVQMLLAALLFVVSNWLGSYSVASDYQLLSLLDKVDEAPAFNVVFRILTPVVFYVLTAALLHAIGLHAWTHNYYMLLVYYFGGRLLYNVVIGHGRLLSWPRHLAIATTSCAIAYALYRGLVANPEALLPQTAELANELWILIILYLYTVLNRMPWGQSGASRRRLAFITSRFRALEERFGRIVREHTRTAAEEALVYAVLIYESFNRPAIFRALERHVGYRLGFARSFGILQVQANRPLSDVESVELGAAKLAEALRTALATSSTEGPTVPDSGSWYDLLSAVRTAAHQYNVRSDYPGEIEDVFDTIVRSFYPHIAQKFSAE